MPNINLFIISLFEKVSIELNIRSYVVGGYIRDEIIGLENRDIDLAVEGNGIEFAIKLNKYINGIINVHKDFKTATIKTNEYTIDIVSTRMEIYDRPGALPKITLSDIKDDIKRRDFTINMIAYDVINKKIIDLFNGIDDIKNKVIKVIHDKSFIDDPTRIFRAIRYSIRLCFEIEKHTDFLIKQAVSKGYLNYISKDRILNEIFLILIEKKPEEMIKKIKEYNIENKIFPKLKLNKKNINTTANGDLLLYRFIILFYYINEDGLKYLVDNYNLKSDYVDSLCNLIKIKNDIKYLKSKNNSEIYYLFKNANIETLTALYMMENDIVKNMISLYLKKLSKTKLDINGDDIRKFGIQPSKVYKYLLDKVLEKKLNGEIKNKDEEIKVLKSYISVLKRGDSL